MIIIIIIIEFFIRTWQSVWFSDGDTVMHPLSLFSLVKAALTEIETELLTECHSVSLLLISAAFL